MEKEYYYLFAPTHADLFDNLRFGGYLKENDIKPYKICAFKLNKVYKGKQYYSMDRLITMQIHDWKLLHNVLGSYGIAPNEVSIREIIINTLKECPETHLYKVIELTYKEYLEYRDKCRYIG